MVETKSKIEQMLELSDEILGNLEGEDISFEKTLLKCKRLARMRGDYEAVDWFTLELHGYNKKDIPSNIKHEELYRFAQLSGRNTLYLNPTTLKEEGRYWSASIPEMEAETQTCSISLENLTPPSQFTPAVSKGSYESPYTGATSNEYVVEKYQDVLNALTIQRNALSEKIKHNMTLISKIKNNIYNYILKINLQLKFENITESIFQDVKEQVDKLLAEICPEAMKKFIAAYERLQSKNPEEWSQSLSTCRNILKDFADYVFPAQKTQYKMKSGEQFKVTDKEYKNRLLAFIDRESKGSKRKLLTSRIGDLTKRIHSLNDILSKGVHAGMEMELRDVELCVIDTYLLIGSLISFVRL